MPANYLVYINLNIFWISPANFLLYIINLNISLLHMSANFTIYVNLNIFWMSPLHMPANFILYINLNIFWISPLHKPANFLLLCLSTHVATFSLIIEMSRLWLSHVNGCEPRKLLLETEWYWAGLSKVKYLACFTHSSGAWPGSVVMNDFNWFWKRFSVRISLDPVLGKKMVSPESEMASSVIMLHHHHHEVVEPIILLHETLESE